MRSSILITRAGVVATCLCVAHQSHAETPVVGFADTHAHFAVHVAHGGEVFAGKPYAEGGMAQALRHCDHKHGPLGLGINVEFGHTTSVFPEFEGWPQFTNTVHQQAYVDWIERAWRGGLRLVVNLVSNNEFLPRIAGHSLPFDDNSVIDASLKESEKLVAYVDRKAGGPGRGFLRIVRSPAEARKAIGDGKLAMVLGVEVDAPGNWRKFEDLPSSMNASRPIIRNYLTRLYAQGVRHFFPIHLADNALGGTAISMSYFDVLTFIKEKRFFEVESRWDLGLRYRLDQDPLVPKGPLSSLLDAFTHGKLQEHARELAKIRGGHANKRGLTVHGQVAVEEMMRLGMMIDIDHMSLRARDRTLSIAETKDYPLVSGHAAFRSLAYSGDAEYAPSTQKEYGTALPTMLSNEAHIGDEELARIRKIGGLVSVALAQGSVRSAPNSKVRNDCDRSSKTFAQAYQYAISKMGGQGVPLATDVHGFVEPIGPRFGAKACWGAQSDSLKQSRRGNQVDAQESGVRYTSRVVDYRAHRFDSVDGDKAYSDEERRMWEAIAIAEAGIDPRKDRIDSPLFLERPVWVQDTIRNIVIGLLSKGNSDDFKCAQPAIDCASERRVGYYVKTGRPVAASESKRMHSLFSALKRVYVRWQAMNGGSTAPLIRNVAGRRDFDFNLDGFAHYGLLPDFIADLQNVGLSRSDLSPLFQSAEAYIRAWEKAEVRAKVVSSSL